MNDEIANKILIELQKINSHLQSIDKSLLELSSRG